MVATLVRPDRRLEDDVNRRRFLGAAGIAALGLAGCAAPATTAPAPAASAGFPVAVDGKFGPTSVDAPPQRVLALGYGPDAATLLALGVRPVAVTRDTSISSGVPPWTAAAGWLPWLLDGRGPAGDPPVDLGSDILDLGAGPSTRLPPDRVQGLHVAVDPAPVDPGGGELEPGPAALPWPDGSFTAVVALLVLHHMPSIEAQDAALAEWARVLRPGGVLVGLNPIDGPHFRRLDTEQRARPVDPLTLPRRLTAAGFRGVRVRVWSLVGFWAVRGSELPA